MSLIKIEAGEGTPQYEINPKWFAVQKPRGVEGGESLDIYHGGNGLGDSLTFIDAGVRLKFTVEKILGRKATLKRVNTNLQVFGQEAGFHKDCLPHEHHIYTLVVFVVDSWNSSWGGEFVYQDSAGDYHSIPCLPNSAVLFPSNLEHRGSAPNRMCREIRRSLAFTYSLL